MNDLKHEVQTRIILLKQTRLYISEQPEIEVVPELQIMSYCMRASNTVLRESVTEFLPSRVHVAAVAKLQGFVGLPIISTLHVVDRFLPYSKVIFLYHLLPAEALC